jgi:hypothetical protein
VLCNGHPGSKIAPQLEKYISSLDIAWKIGTDVNYINMLTN